LASEGTEVSSILVDTQLDAGIWTWGSIMEDQLGLGEDRWWERGLSRWQHLSDRMRTGIWRGLVGIVAVASFLVLNVLMGRPVG
jgi:hypothetical protein